jgi:S-adenosylmethionine/arginine decarboxylase-like enzyme
MHGMHLTADLRGCPAAQPAMTDPDALRALCLRALQAAGLRAVGELFHRFERDAAHAAAANRPAGASAGTRAGTDAQAAADAPAGGVTGVVLLAESHLAVHTWPELGAVTLDVYVCNRAADHSARAHAALDALVDAFAPRGGVERHAIARGELAGTAPR